MAALEEADVEIQQTLRKGVPEVVDAEEKGSCYRIEIKEIER